MENKTKVAIIGGGASGLVCAIFAAREGNLVTIFEKQDRVGKKILQTGNGRCNFCNINLDCKYYNDENFVKKVFDKFNLQDIEQFFESIGLVWYADAEGRMYPQSNMASSVLDVLRYECDRLGVKVVSSKCVDEIQKSGEIFIVESNKFDKVIVACGNENQTLLTKFGHKQKAFKDSLTAIKTPRDEVFNLNGIRAKCKVFDEFGFCESGEVQFKENGLSGICIFNFSSHICKNFEKTSQFYVDLLPEIEISDLIYKLKCRIKHLKDENISNVFVGIFHKNIAQLILKRVAIDSNKKCSDISDTQIENVANFIKKCPFTYCGTIGNGQVKSGGYLTDDFDDNCQSRIIKNLFAIGECLDVDGKCGGFNLAWAWASGAVAGSAN